MYENQAFKYHYEKYVSKLFSKYELNFIKTINILYLPITVNLISPIYNL